MKTFCSFWESSSGDKWDRVSIYEIGVLITTEGNI